MEVQLLKTFSFEAAHRHPGDSGPGGRIHGHSFKVETLLKGPVDPESGWVVDFAVIKREVKPVLDLIDHRYLNDIAGLEVPSPEKVSDWIASRLRARLDFDLEVRVDCRETTSAEIERLRPSRPGSLPERWVLRFEAAHSLPKTPPGHKCRRLHGHSYRLEVEATEPAPVPKALERLFELLDHRCLNDVEGLENPTAEIMAGFFGDRLSREGVEPASVFVSETCESGCFFFGK